MADATNNLALPYIMAAQAQKHVTHNEAITALDALVQLSVVSRTLNEAPPTPAEGQRYIVSAAPTSDWAEHAMKIAAYQDGAWAYHAPREGWCAWVENEQRLVVFSQGNWIDLNPQSSIAEFGSRTILQTVEDEVHLDGAFKLATIQIPNRAILLGVSVRVVATITGASAFEVGTASEPSRFGGLLGTNPGDSNIGVIGPTAFYADTPIRITSIGGNFQGGTVHLALHTIECGPPLT